MFSLLAVAVAACEHATASEPADPTPAPATDAQMPATDAQTPAPDAQMPAPPPVDSTPPDAGVICHYPAALWSPGCPMDFSRSYGGQPCPTDGLACSYIDWVDPPWDSGCDHMGYLECTVAHGGPVWVATVW